MKHRFGWLWSRAQGALQAYSDKTEARALEAHLAELTLVWGLWLLLPMDSFRAAPAFDIMRNAFPLALRGLAEPAWGLAAAFVGGLMLWGIVRDYNRPQRWGFILATGFWLMVTVGLLVANWQTTGSPMYAVMALRVFLRGRRL